MKVSRAPEKRGGVNKTLVYVSLIVAAVIIGILITYFATGFESPAATGDETGVPKAASNVTPGVNQSPPGNQTEPTPTPQPTATPMPTVAVRAPQSEPEPLPGFIPDVHFGEVLSEGFVDIQLPGNNIAQSWYTFQVDTVTRDLTLFFALYDESLKTITRTVKIEGYSQGGDLENIEVTLFYPEGPERVIVFDRSDGTMQVTQRFQQPYNPSMFSPELRVSLVNQRMVLTDEAGTASAELQLDLTGLSGSEVMVFKRTAPEIVANVLSEMRGLVDQIEAKRPR